eukprot:Nk52_evm2s378 gene=Nk52_evmTU2s378
MSVGTMKRCCVPIKRDPSSFSNMGSVRVSHFDLKLTICFEEQLFRGSVDISLECTEDIKEVILDTKDLTIHSITHKSSEQRLEYTLGEDTPFGNCLTIRLAPEEKKGSSFGLVIEYATSNHASAVQFLTPEQTLNKTHPFVFTQCQAIHCRSMIPCMDSPSVKSTYSAQITVPEEHNVVMSAVIQNEKTIKGDGKATYFFHQAVPTPAYLVAIAAGRLEFRELGSRCGVWAEPPVVEAAAWEFESTEKFLKVAEDLCGPYEYGRYDMLLLPPSFPYGGMENPCMTFVTPCLLSGDRSLVNVVAHEISHSWTGNLVTNAHWGNFWLNEGFTVYLERAILREIDGEKERQFASIGGLIQLKEDIDVFGHDSPLTCLTLNNEGINPDDAFSLVPYEKGYNFLYYLEQVSGGFDVFKKYIKAHIQNFKHQSITVHQWREFFNRYFAEEISKGVFDCVDWDEWLLKPGMPPVDNKFESVLATDALELAKRWKEFSKSGASSHSFDKKDVENFNTMQTVSFFEDILKSPGKLTTNAMKAMDSVYNFSTVQNNEVKYSWQTLALRSGYDAVVDSVVEFLLAQGRMKYVRSLYRDLNALESAGNKAKETFLANRNFYHPIAAALIAKDIKLV